MYTVVLATAMMATAASPGWHRCHGCYSCYSGYGGYGGYSCGSMYSCYSCYGAFGCAAGCGGYYGCVTYSPGYGCAGACYGYHGGCYSGFGIWTGEPYLGGCTGCYGCYGGYSCYGVPVPFPGQGAAPGTNVVPPPVRDPFPPINPEAGKKKSPEVVVPPQEEKKKVDGKDEQVRAKIRIEIPAGGKLFVDGRAIKTSPGTRVFNTPNLQIGQTYFYDVRIEVERDGAVQSEQRRIIIRSGEDVAVAFPNLQTTPSLTARGQE